MSKKKELAALHEQIDALTVQTNHILDKNKRKLVELKEELPKVYRQRFDEANAEIAKANAVQTKTAEAFSEKVKAFNESSREFHDLIDDILGGC